MTKKNNTITRRVDRDAIKAQCAAIFDTVLRKQQPAARSFVERQRRLHPDQTPELLIKSLDKLYLTSVGASGVGAGVAAVVPNGFVQVPVALVDFTANLESSVMYVLALAEIYGVDVEDFERRKFLVTLALLGDSAAKKVTQVVGERTVPYWSKTIINAIPMRAIKGANKILGPWFITKYGTKQGMLVLSKQLPLALGVLVGAGGNAMFGYLVIRSTKKLLGTPPENWNHLDSVAAELIPNEDDH